MRFVALLLLLAGKLIRRVQYFLYRPFFGAHGKNFWFDPAGTYSFSTIYVGSHVFLGLRPILLATRSRIVIGSNVMFGPEVTIIGGNHVSDCIRRFMVDICDEDKRPKDNKGVIIQDDVWVGREPPFLTEWPAGAA